MSQKRREPREALAAIYASIIVLYSRAAAAELERAVPNDYTCRATFTHLLRRTPHNLFDDQEHQPVKLPLRIARRKRDGVPHVRTYVDYTS